MMSVPDGCGGHQYRLVSDVERTLLMDGLGTGDDFPDPFGEHDIEWWVCDGDRLIPATVDEIHAIEEHERSRAALRRLAAMERSQRGLRYLVSRRLTMFARTLRVVRVWRHDETIHHTPPEPRPAPPERVGETP